MDLWIKFFFQFGSKKKVNEKNLGFLNNINKIKKFVTLLSVNIGKLFYKKFEYILSEFKKKYCKKIKLSIRIAKNKFI